jgi:hypothetical protein
LAVVDGDHLQGRSESLQDSRSGPAVHLWAMAQEETSLEQRISQQDWRRRGPGPARFARGEAAADGIELGALAAFAGASVRAGQ